METFLPRPPRLERRGRGEAAGRKHAIVTILERLLSRDCPDDVANHGQVHPRELPKPELSRRLEDPLVERSRPALLRQALTAEALPKADRYRASPPSRSAR